MNNELENKINVALKRLALEPVIGRIKEGPIKLLQVNNSLLYLHSSMNHLFSLTFEERIHTDVVVSGHIHIDEFDLKIVEMISRNVDPERFLEILLSSETPSVISRTYQYNVVMNGEKVGEIAEKDFITNHQAAIEKWRVAAKDIADVNKRNVVLAITSPVGSRSVFYIKPRRK